MSSLKSIIYVDVEPAYQVEILDYVLSITYDNVELACHIEKVDYVLSVIYINVELVFFRCSPPDTNQQKPLHKHHQPITHKITTTLNPQPSKFLPA